MYCPDCRAENAMAFVQTGRCHLCNLSAITVVNRVEKRLSK